MVKFHPVIHCSLEGRRPEEADRRDTVRNLRSVFFGGLGPGQPKTAAGKSPCDAGLWEWVEHLFAALLTQPRVSPEFDCLQYTFLSQVGYREGSAGGGRTFWPTGFVKRLRTFVNIDYQEDRNGALISRDVVPGFGMDTRWNGFMQFRYIDDRIRAGGLPIDRRQFGYIAQFSPSRRVTRLAIDGRTGQEIDFANARPATGTTINLSASLDPTNHLDVSLVQNQRWVNVDARSLITFAYRRTGRLFNSQILNAPAWLEAERFDITAKSGSALAAAPAGEISRAMPLLVQSLLED